MALKPLTPGYLPVGQYDLLDSFAANFVGGEVGIIAADPGGDYYAADAGGSCIVVDARERERIASRRCCNDRRAEQLLRLLRRRRGLPAGRRHALANAPRPRGRGRGPDRGSRRGEKRGRAERARVCQGCVSCVGGGGESALLPASANKGTLSMIATRTPERVV